MVRENIYSLVAIYDEDNFDSGDKTENVASGVIIGQSKEDVFIVTNYHAISSQQNPYCVFYYSEEKNNNEFYLLNINGYSEVYDIAVVSIKKM